MNSLAEALWIVIPAISSVAYGLLFFLRRQELRNVSRWFSLFLGMAALWSLGSMFLHANIGLIDPVWLARLLMFGNFGVPVAIFGFTAHFLSLPRQQALIPVAVVLYVITGLINLSGYVVVSTVVDQGLVTNEYGWGMVVISIVWSGCFYPSIFLLVRELRRTHDPAFRNRLRYLLATFILLLIASLLNVTPLSAYPLDHLLAGLTAILISLSISRYQLLEIRLAIRRLAVLLLVVALYLVVVSGSIYVLAGLERPMLLPGSLITAGITAVLLFSYRPVRQGISTAVERVFFPEQYNVHALIFTISRLSNQLRPPEALGADVLRELSTALRCEHASLFIRQEPGGGYRQIASAGRPADNVETVFRFDSPLVKELAAYGRAMHIDRLHELPRLQALWIDEWHMLESLRAEVLVPVSAEKELIGFFVLSARHSREPFTRWELQQTLPLLANQVSIALANSWLYVQEQRRADQLDRANTALRQTQSALKESAEQVQREAARAKALVLIADQLNAQLDLATVLSAVCEAAARAVNAPAASVDLYSEKRDTLYHAAGYGLPDKYCSQAQPLPRAVYDRFTQPMGTGLIASDVLADADLLAARSYHELRHELDIHTVMLTSMVREGKLVGSLNVFAIGLPSHVSEDVLELLKGIAAQAAQAIVNARLFADAQRRLRNVEALREVDAAITGGGDLRRTLRVILDQVTDQLNINAADVLLMDARTNTLVYMEGRGFSVQPVAGVNLQSDHDCAALVVSEHRMVHIADITVGTHPLCRPVPVREGFKSYLGVPLIVKGQVKGVLEIYQRGVLDKDQEWLSFLNALCTQAAIAIDNSELLVSLQRSNAELSAAYDSTLEGWAHALELRDHETEGHTRRVAEMAVELAREMGLGEEAIVHIRRGAILHDVGKMAVPDSILLKPGPLTDEEWCTMRQHPVYAYQMLSPISFLQPALVIPYSHHEKWDGTGYPEGLKGEDIPLWARIFAVVDVWDALRSDRPYHRAWPDDRAREHLQQQAGRHFDPQVVETFLRLWQAERDRQPEIANAAPVCQVVSEKREASG